MSSLINGITAAAGAAPPVYVEDVFSTYLYAGNNSTQTITNNIDLSTKGGLVWIKIRDSGITSHRLFDTARGTSKYIDTGFASAERTDASPYGVSSFNSNGFTVSDTSGTNWGVNISDYNYASWTFRKQKKFFDIVTYTGTGSARTISHNLGSTPGMIITKRTDNTGNWCVYHRSLTSANYFLTLNTTNGQFSDSARWNDTAPTSSVFTVGTDGDTNSSGATYVAYLFAHDAGGFGLSGSDSIISCGSYTGSSTVTLGWEPQFILVKKATNNSGMLQPWYIFDNMRGMFGGNIGSTSYPEYALELKPNTSDPEASNNFMQPTPTGFISGGGGADALFNGGTDTYIYMAIRRGPMKIPTDATKVFAPVTYTGTSSARSLTTGFPVDTEIVSNTDGGFQTGMFFDKIRGSGIFLTTNATYSDQDYSSGLTSQFDSMTTVKRTGSYFNSSAATYVSWNLKRAAGFFDVVCYTGTGSATTVAHNLGVVPELMILKGRSLSTGWTVYSNALTLSETLSPNTNAAKATGTDRWNNTSPTSSVFSLSTSSAVNNSTSTYVAYLFATCPGVSKCGSYTGTGTTNQINCGFTNGARFVLIKRTDSTGDWYVWDSARGIIAGNDPYLLLNSTAAEVTNTDYIDPYSAGFELSSTAPAALNANGGTYIFLAIA